MYVFFSFIHDKYWHEHKRTLLVSLKRRTYTNSVFNQIILTQNCKKLIPINPESRKVSSDIILHTRNQWKVYQISSISVNTSRFSSTYPAFSPVGLLKQNDRSPSIPCFFDRILTRKNHSFHGIWTVGVSEAGRRKDDNMILWLPLAFRLFTPLPSVVYTVHLSTNLDKCNDTRFMCLGFRFGFFLHSAYSCKPTWIHSLICSRLGIFVICILKGCRLNPICLDTPAWFGQWLLILGSS